MERPLRLHMSVHCVHHAYLSFLLGRAASLYAGWTPDISGAGKQALTVGQLSAFSALAESDSEGHGEVEDEELEDDESKEFEKQRQSMLEKAEIEHEAAVRGSSTRQQCEI